MEYSGQGLDRPAGAALEIERRRANDVSYKTFLREYVRANRPVILEGAVRQWAALRKWTPEYFKENFGAQEVEITYGVRGRLGDVVDAVLASTKERPGPYLHKVLIRRDMPQLMEDLSPENEYGFPRRMSSRLMPSRFRKPDGLLKLLIGGVGGRFPIVHYDSDNSNAIITEIYGDKEFLFFAPGDTPYMYAKANTCQVNDVESPDLARFPLFAKATPYRGVVHPGDMAFVPSGWWHSARVVSTSISVCTNMIDRSNWQGFVNECCSVDSGGSKTKTMLKRVSLVSIGKALDVLEWAQERTAGTAVSRVLAGVAPIASPGHPARR